MREQYESEEGVLPVRYYDKHFYFVDWHWHDEVEFTEIQCDQLICEIGNEQVVVNRGDCIMINSKVLHRYLPVDESGKESLWDSLLFSPEVIADMDSAIHRNFIAPIIQSSRSYLVFDQTIPWQKEAVDHLKEAEKYCIDCPPAVDLYLKRALTALWIQLAEHKELFPEYQNGNSKQRQQERLRMMIRYIWEHYQESLTLADIAGVVHVSERTAERCFKEEIQVTPLIYLQNYRLRCAKRLLQSSTDNILEIALACGFESSSYFDRVFKNTYGMTPRQYRGFLQ